MTTCRKGRSGEDRGRFEGAMIDVVVGWRRQRRLHPFRHQSCFQRWNWCCCAGSVVSGTLSSHVTVLMLDKVRDLDSQRGKMWGSDLLAYQPLPSVRGTRYGSKSSNSSETRPSTSTPGAETRHAAGRDVGAASYRESLHQYLAAREGVRRRECQLAAYLINTSQHRSRLKSLATWQTDPRSFAKVIC